MARKLRIQYEEAIYHVINRGNYAWITAALNMGKASSVRAYLRGKRK
jgi:hypothetical protein